MVSIEFLRQFRFSGYAIFDFIAAFLGIYLLSPILSNFFRKIRLDIPTTSWLFFTLPISVLAHLAVRKITPLTQDFIDPNGHNIVKVIIIISFFWGLKGIKIIKKQN